MIQYPRGSEWRKWDLHLHSNASDGTSSPEDIVQKVKEEGLSVIALTDHHTVKNIDEIKELCLSKGITVISGIEFRTEYGQKSVHMIGLFPNKHKNIQLNSKALHDLVLSPLNLSETKIIAKGKEKDSSLNDEQAFKEGIFLVQVPFKDAADKIHEYGGIVLVHAGSKSNSLDEEMKHEGKGEKNVQTLYESLGTVKEELFQHNYIDICEIRKENDSEEFYWEKFKKPSIIASDAHEISEIGTKFTWIKADPTFEGLKQIIYEPNERVKIQPSKPEEKAGYYVIDSIKLEQDKFWNQTIPLNPNLVTIIGGRSTGKSTLLGSIAKRIDNSIDSNEFINDHTQSVEIIWQDEEQAKYRDIEFFPQNYMYEIAKDTQKTDELIEKIIKDKDESKLLIAYNNFCDNNRTELINKINTLFQLQSEIDKRKVGLKEKGDKQGIEKEIKLLEERINKVDNEKAVTQEVLSEYEKINKVISEKEQLLIILGKDREAIESLKSKNIFNQLVEYEFNSFSEKTRVSITDILNKVKQEATRIWLELLGKKDSYLKEQIQLLLREIEVEKDKEAYQGGAKYFQDNKQYQELQSKLKEERKKLSEISETEKSLKNQEAQKQILKKEIIDSHCNYYKNAVELANSLKLECGGISITPSVIFKKDSISSFINERFNQRGTDRQNYVSEFVNNYQSKMVEYTNDFLQQTLEKKIDFKGIYSDKSQPTVSSELLSANWFNITYKLTYQNDVLLDMSPGKQAFVILKLLLEFSDKKCPILIDQPEDSLDNRAIYNELVKYLKDKKKERQIVVVTHNPNVVVGADSEQVLVANQHGKDSKNKDSIKFQYVAGSLENTKEKDKANKIVLESQGIREHVCEILEGGSEAFKKREQKYNLPNDFKYKED
jgi:hypothetical protein